ncbi:MAG: ubiquinol-cytochrome c reductase iron-sulfur subunit [Phycisphaerales bacterium]
MSDGCQHCQGDCGGQEPSRRTAMFKIGLGLMGVGTVVTSAPLLGSLLAPGFRREGDTWVDLGATGDYPEGETRLAKFALPGANPNDGATASAAAWVRSMSGGKFQVFAVNCAHLGCPVKWFQQSRLFMCPCHGGVYYEDGNVASGPPPRGLFEFEWKVENGRLLIAAGRLPGMQEST